MFALLVKFDNSRLYIYLISWTLTILNTYCVTVKRFEKTWQTARSFSSALHDSNKLDKLIINAFILSGSESDLYLSDSGLSIAYSPPRGIYDAYNQAVKLSLLKDSDWIWLLGEGDTIENIPYSLLLGISNLQSNQNIVVSGDMIVGDRKGINNLHKMRPQIAFNLDAFRVNHPSMIVSKQAYQEVGLYDPNESILSDYKWYLKAKFQGVSFINSSVLHVYHELGGISTTQPRNFTLHSRALSSIKKYSFPLYSIAFVMRTLRYFLKSILIYS